MTASPGSAGRIVTSALIAAVLVIAACGSEPDDLRLVQVTHLQPVDLPGQTLPVQNDTTRIWLSKAMARADSPKSSFILREDTGVLYNIDHQARTYVAIPLQALGELPELLGVDRDEPSNPDRRLQLMRNFDRLYAQVRATEQSAEIEGFRCRRYEMNLMMGRARIVSTYWVTREIDTDQDLLRRITRVGLLNLPGADQMIEEMAKMDGLAVLIESEMEFLGKTTHSSSRLIEVSHAEAPPGIFDIPENYERLDLSLPSD
jgi:hypothetical protein